MRECEPICYSPTKMLASPLYALVDNGKTSYLFVLHQSQLASLCTLINLGLIDERYRDLLAI